MWELDCLDRVFKWEPKRLEAGRGYGRQMGVKFTHGAMGSWNEFLSGGVVFRSFILRLNRSLRLFAYYVFGAAVSFM